MCGVFCFFSGKEEINSDKINAEGILTALARRGPDGHGVFDELGVFMAHTRLSILDLHERSNQPFVGNRWVLSYNGEIFNHQDLRRELEKEGARFSTNCDTEVLYRAIEYWGPRKAVSRLCGMFAFAAFDRIERQLWLARDPLGIKPLFIVRGDGYLACASWSSALLNGVKESWQLDREGLASYFQLGAPQDGLTLVEGISSLPSGELWQIDANLKVCADVYWRPEQGPEGFETDGFESLLHKVVGEHLAADVPMALLLSGGVDSTALGCFFPKGSAAFHLDSPEMQNAREASEFLGFDFYSENSDLVDDWEPWLFAFSAATGGAFAAVRQPLLMSKAMAAAGFKVGLSANGADELFLGYPRTPAPGLDPLVITGLPAYEGAPAETFAEQVAHIFGDDANFLSPSASSEEVECEHEKMIYRLKRRLEAAANQVGEAAAYRLFELRTYVEQDLNPTLDHASMYNSLEVRVPFLDHRLVSYVLRASSNDLIHPELGRKAPLKRILLEKGVPGRIWNRAKVGFSLPASSIVAARTTGLRNLRELLEDGYVRFFPRKGLLVRDFQRVLAAATAFAAWKRAWIDTGIVRTKE